MSKKAIAQAVKNVKFSGMMGARNEEAHDRQYANIKQNADALATLHIMDWVEAFELLAKHYYESMEQEKNLQEAIKRVLIAKV